MLGFARLGRDRRSATATLFSIMAIPLLGMVGLAIDFGIWNQTSAALSLAASSAALNAAKTAGNAYLQNDSSYSAEGASAGRQWFEAELVQSTYAETASSLTPTVSIAATSTSVTATVTYSGTVPSIFGRLFSVARYSIGGSAAASVPIAPYLEVVLFLDNSSSMLIGATNADIAKLMSLSPCDASAAFYGSASAGWTSQTQVNYGNYACSDAGNSYDGVTSCPVALPSASTAGYTLAAPWNKSYFTINTPASNRYPASTTLDTCQGALAKQSNGTYPLTGPPCAFACHWSTTKNTDGTYQDLYGMARRFNVTLRFDTVKAAANTALQAMAQDTISSLNNISVGIYTFNTSVTQIYPTGCTKQATGCEAGTNFTSAEALVGTGDAGIAPHMAVTTGNNDDTDYPDDMTSLQTYLTQAGTGVSASAPKKVLILITDGLQDNPVDGSRQAFSPSYCQLFKNWGYTVYVAFTPYYPLMHTYYLDNMIPIVEGAGSTSLSYNLQSCASSSSGYVAASDQTSLNNALLSFLKQSLNGPAIFTQ